MARKTKSTAKATDGTVKLNVLAPKPKTDDQTPAIVQKAQPVTTRGLIKKPEFLEKAIARTEVKKRDAKPVIEAALAELSELLASDHELNIPPLGKLKLVKSKDIGDGAKVLTLKLRTMKDSAGKPKPDDMDV